MACKGHEGMELRHLNDREDEVEAGLSSTRSTKRAVKTTRNPNSAMTTSSRLMPQNHSSSWCSSTHRGSWSSESRSTSKPTTRSASMTMANNRSHLSKRHAVVNPQMRLMSSAIAAAAGPVRPDTEELIRLQEQRERAREQERLERRLEQERLERENKDNLIPDSKKAPQVLAAISVSTGCISYGICMAYTSAAIPSMLSPNDSSSIEINSQQISWMSSLLALGSLFGSLGAVYLMDAVGRKAALLAFSVMSLFIGWTLLMAASQPWQLYVGRFLLGLGAGLEITISPVYIHEICRPVLRDVCGSFPQVFIAIGVLLCYLMGRDMEWNWLALVSCMFLFPFTFGLYFIPESPPWLVYNDEEDLAFKSMVLIRGEEYDATVEIRRIKDNLTRHRNDLHALLHESESCDLSTGGALLSSSNRSSMSHFHQHGQGHQQPLKKFTPRELFTRSVFYPFSVILVLMFLLQFSGQGAVTFYTALIFEEAECSVDPKNSSVIIGLSYLLSSILGLFLKKHMGRRVLLLLSEFGMALSQLAMGTYFHMLKRRESTSANSTAVSDAEESSIAAPFAISNSSWTESSSAFIDVSEVPWLPIPILVTFTIAFNIGMGSLTWVVATEILPVRSKRWTHTISNVTSNFWWFVVTKTFKDIYSTFGPEVPFLIYGGVCAAGFLFILIFLPETHGKTAEETALAFAPKQTSSHQLSRTSSSLSAQHQQQTVESGGGCCSCARDVCQKLSRCWPMRALQTSAPRTPNAPQPANGNAVMVGQEIELT